MIPVSTELAHPLIISVANLLNKKGHYIKHVSGLFVRVHAMIYPNRAMSSTNGDILERAYLCFGSVWSGDRAEGWYLEWLAVDPNYQGKRIGKRLAQWGLDRAEEEQVWASVASSEGKEEFYRDKCGFNEEYWSAGMGEGNPLAGSNIGRMFWRRPRKNE
jgi:GNAT superfamily N-acetyltransferase